MGDLISRSDTMKRLRNYAEQKHYNGEVELANGILKAICFIEYEENIPTAYDVEKVVEDLQKVSMIIEQNENSIKCAIEENMAVHIVKRGGWNDK